MPYIKPEERDALSHTVMHLENEAKTAHAGMVNYLITKLCSAWLVEHGVSYPSIASITGILENVKQEFYQRVARTYEDAKLKENGDVYN